MVPEIGAPEIREILHRRYRIVYRLVREDEIHILTVHHSARQFPDSL